MSMKRNINLIYIIGSLMWMRFFVPVLALFYIASQVSIEEFAIIMGVFALATLLFEVPSGVVADLLGRKKTLIISRAMYVIEIFIIAFFNGFYPFLIAKIISGIGVSLSSGTGSSLLYETLKKLKREKEHKIISGKLATISSISMAFVFIIGSFLFTMNPKLPAYVSLPLITLGLILTFFIEEPYQNTHKITFKKSLIHLKEGIVFFKKHKILIAITIYSVPVAAIISIALSMSSAYLEVVRVPLFLIGTVAFIGSLLMAFGSKNANKLEEKIGEKKSMNLIYLIMGSSIILMMLLIPYAGAIFYLMIPLVSGFFGVLINHYMNEHVGNTHRATMLSIKNMFENIGIFILFPIIGLLTKNYSFTIAYGLLLGVLATGYIIFQIITKIGNIKINSN